MKQFPLPALSDLAESDLLGVKPDGHFSQSFLTLEEVVDALNDPDLLEFVQANNVVMALSLDLI